MFTVALIGQDGVGKTSVANRLAATFPVPLEYLYMGDNVRSSNHTLPTTRWWKSRKKVRPPAEPTPERHATRPRSPVKRLRHTARKTLGFVNGIAEELYRASVATYYRKRGTIVLLDRHFALDYYHEDHAATARARPLRRRLQGFFRTKINRLPDLVICLDAPPEVAFARKGEFSPEFLAKRRSQYLSLRDVVGHFEVVDAQQDLDHVVQNVTEQILCFRNGILERANT